MRHHAFRGAVLAFIFTCVCAIAQAAPYAAMVIDAKTGEVLHSKNADTRLHPASLTKMMTLYVVFGAIERGEISIHSKVKVSKRAASQPPSKLGLRAGSSIQIRHLVRATAVKSANDAALVLAEAVSGSQESFAKRMTRQAKQLGMTRTTFKNPHGLTQKGHLSTARDMTILGQRLMRDFPGYYHLFSRRSADAGIKTVSNTNRRLLNGYKGADGIKTGYTNAAGFNLVSSAHRGNKRVIATVFGGKSSADRYSRIARLLDIGFGRVGDNKRYATIETEPKKQKAKVIVVADVLKKKKRLAPLKSPRPRHRPSTLVAFASSVTPKEQKDVEAAILASMQDQIIEPEQLEQPTIKVASASVLVEQEAMIIQAIARNIQPEPTPAAYIETEAVVVERVKTTKGAKAWAVQLGAYGSRYQAEKVLLRTALSDMRSLDGALRKIEPTIIKGQRLYRAQFVGISKTSAGKTCARLSARSIECSPVLSGS